MTADEIYSAAAAVAGVGAVAARQNQPALVDLPPLSARQRRSGARSPGAVRGPGRGGAMGAAAAAGGGRRASWVF